MTGRPAGWLARLVCAVHGTTAWATYKVGPSTATECAHFDRSGSGTSTLYPGPSPNNVLQRKALHRAAPPLPCQTGSVDKHCSAGWTVPTLGRRQRSPASPTRARCAS
eukprot:274357-Chlamydomonas_euryale.AAC.1